MIEAVFCYDEFMKNKTLTNRLILGTLLGVMFGVMCFTGFSSNPDMPVEMTKWQLWSWSNAMMWGTISNRMLLGVVVALAGFITRCPVFGFRISVWLRGMKIGFLVSLPMAVGALMNENPQAAQGSFLIVLMAGIIIGMIIDLIITKFVGDGDALCAKSKS